MRQSGVARVGKGSPQRQSESGSGAARSSAPPDSAGTLSLGEAHGNRALVSHLGRLAIQRKCAKCEEEDEEAVTIQRFARGSAAGASVSSADEQTTEPAARSSTRADHESRHHARARSARALARGGE